MQNKTLKIFLLYQIWCLHYIFEQVTYVLILFNACFKEDFIDVHFWQIDLGSDWFSSVSYYRLLVWKRIKFYAIYDDVFAQLNKPIPIS